MGSGSGKRGSAAREKQRGQAGESAGAPPTSPGAGVSLPAAARLPDLGPEASPFRPPRALPLPLPSSSHPASESQTAPVQLQAGRGQSQGRPRPSSGQEAAGRAGEGGDRKRRASSLPFLRGVRVTGKGEGPPTRERQRTSRPRTRLLRPAAQRHARCCRRRRGEAASIAMPEGEGRVGRELGGEAGELAGGGANRLRSQPPAGRHVGRCGGRWASRAGALTGRRRRCPARALGPPGAPTPWARRPSLCRRTS